MARVTLRRKPTDLQGWPTSTLLEITEALSDWQSQGWRGGIGTMEDGRLRLELNADAPPRQIIVYQGDWLIDDGDPRVVSAADVTVGYDVVPTPPPPAPEPQPAPDPTPDPAPEPTPAPGPQIDPAPDDPQPQPDPQLEPEAQPDSQPGTTDPAEPTTTEGS